MGENIFFYYISGVLSTLGISFCAFKLSLWASGRVMRWLISLMLISCLYMFFAQVLKYLSLHFYADFSHWLQVIYSIITTGKPLNFSHELIVPRSLNYLSVHFVPAVYLVAIPFSLFPHPITLITLNFILMISSGIPLYKLALLNTGDKKFALLTVVLLFWYPTFQYTVLYEFEILRFSIPVILWMLYFWEKRRTAMYLSFVLLSVLIREEVGLTIMMFGIYLFIFKRKRRLGIITGAIGLGTFLVLTQIVMPALRSTPTYSHIAIGSFNALGKNFGEILTNIVKHPSVLLVTVFQPIKLANIVMLFIPLLGIPFLVPSLLIAIIANIGVGLLSSSTVHISYMLYYLSPSVPFIFYAFIKGWPRALEILKRFAIKCYPDAPVSSALTISMLAGILVSNIFFGPAPISLQFWFKDLKPAPFRTQNFHYSVYKITKHHQVINDFVKLIPDSAIVSTQQFIAPRLFKKRAILIFPILESHAGKFKADYILFDTTNNNLSFQSPAYINPDYFNSIAKDVKNWQLIFAEDSYFLYKRITF